MIDLIMEAARRSETKHQGKGKTEKAREIGKENCLKFCSPDIEDKAFYIVSILCALVSSPVRLASG